MTADALGLVADGNQFDVPGRGQVGVDHRSCVAELDPVARAAVIVGRGDPDDCSFCSYGKSDVPVPEPPSAPPDERAACRCRRARPASVENRLAVMSCSHRVTYLGPHGRLVVAVPARRAEYADPLSQTPDPEPGGAPSCRHGHPPSTQVLNFTSRGKPILSWGRDWILAYYWRARISSGCLEKVLAKFKRCRFYRGRE